MVSQAALNDLHENDYGFFAVVAFLGYEHLITLDAEVALFWQKRLSGVSLLFFVNRYLTLAWAVATAASPYYSSAEVRGKLLAFIRDVPCLTCHPPEVRSPSRDTVSKSFSHREASRCMQSARGLQSVEGFLYFPWAVFSALRVYALGRFWSLAATVFILSMMPNIVKFAATFCIMLVTGLPDHSPDCKTVQGPITNQLANTCKLLTLVSRASLIAAEVIVLAVTWIATYRRSALRETRQRQTLAHVILFNGTTYFLAMLFLNCLQLGFTLASVGPTRKVLNVSEVTNFSEPITSVLITRFLLDLQRVDQRDVVNLDSDGHLSPHSEAVVSPHTLRFPGMLESFGSVIVWEGAEGTDDLEDTEYEVTQ